MELFQRPMDNVHTFVGYRELAICQILFGWKTCKYCYETDETPQPKANPTREKTG